MTQQLLKGGETTAPIHPRASERVPQHVDMEPLDAGEPPRHAREAARLGERNQPPDALANLRQHPGR